jgi:hypothetical protein
MKPKLDLEAAVVAAGLAGLALLWLWSRRAPARAPARPAAPVAVSSAPLPLTLPAEELLRVRRAMDAQTPLPPEEELKRQQQQDRLDRYFAPKAQTPASRASEPPARAPEPSRR